MKILLESLTVCDECGSRHGHIIEKFNGLVPVYCYCDRHREGVTLANPRAMYCEGGTIGPCVIWMPISDSIDEDGRWRHTPWFAGPSIRQTAPGWKPKQAESQPDDNAPDQGHEGYIITCGTRERKNKDKNNVSHGPRKI